jgi:hypothetical protein
MAPAQMLVQQDRDRSTGGCSGARPEQISDRRVTELVDREAVDAGATTPTALRHAAPAPSAAGMPRVDKRCWRRPRRLGSAVSRWLVFVARKRAPRPTATARSSDRWTERRHDARRTRSQAAGRLRSCSKDRTPAQRRACDPPTAGFGSHGVGRITRFVRGALTRTRRIVADRTADRQRI